MEIFGRGQPSPIDRQFENARAGGLISDALLTRPNRAPDFFAEAAALRRLSALLTGDPQILLDTLMAVAVELCGRPPTAATAGVSLLERVDSDHQQFRWVSMAGQLSAHVGGTTPRDDSPCGVCLDEGRPVLFSRPDLLFPYLQATGVPIIEGLVIPFYVAEGAGALGTIWIVSHEFDCRFDAEDVRIMTSLAGFTGAAYQLITTRLAAERSRKDVEAAWFDADRARSAAEAADLAKSQFLATISHEIRTPLNAIGGYAEILELGIHGPANEAQQEVFSRIKRTADHLKGLVGEVLNFSKIESGAVNYDVRDVDLNDLFGRIEEMISPQLKARQIDYSFDDMSVPSWGVRTDPDKLGQILLNLLSNAAKFTSPGGTVHVWCDRGETKRSSPDSKVLDFLGDRPADAGTLLRIHVTDSGRGIPSDMTESIFDPFVQVRHQPDSASEGIGLGLAISRKLARGMGGDLKVESIAGKGSTFTVTLPLDNEVESRSAAEM
ncbi:MAG: HAMP domain-containing sensor histidine kinase [Gemmatimonadales bacterium]